MPETFKWIVMKHESENSDPISAEIIETDVFSYELAIRKAAEGDSEGIFYSFIRWENVYPHYSIPSLPKLIV